MMTRVLLLVQYVLLILPFLYCADGVSEIKKRQYSNVTLPCTDGPVDERVIFVQWFYTLKGEDTEDLFATMMKNGDPWVSNKLKPRWEADSKTYGVTLREALVSDTGVYKCKGSVSNGTYVEEVVNNQINLIITDVPSKPPGKPLVQTLGPDSIRVSWAHSEQDNNSPIKVYSIKYRQADTQTWDDAKTENAPGSVNVTTISGLSSYTGYQVAVLALNSDGYSEMGEPSDVVYTAEALPISKPKIDDSTVVRKNTSIEIHFQPPKLGINGELVGYTLKHRPAMDKDWRVSMSLNPNKTNHTFHNLKPYTYYLVSVQINNNAGAGPSDERVLQTDEGVPSSPDVIDVRNKTHSSVTIYWYPPKEVNGQLVGYKIYWTRADLTISKTVNTTELRKDMNYTIKYLEPKTQYQFQVAAMTAKGTGAKSKPFRVYTDTTGPSEPSISNITWMSPNSFVVQWTRPRVSYGDITRYMIRYRPPNTDDFRTELYFTSDPFEQNPFKMTVLDVDPKSVYYVQVAGATKSMFSSKYHIGKYSNLTETWCSDDVLCKESVQGRTKNKSNTLSIAGVLLGIAATLLVLIIGLILFLLRRKYGSFQYWFVRDPENAYTVAPPEQTIPESKYVAEHEAVPILKWAEHVESLHADSDIGFSQEFDAINQSTGQIPAVAATDVENKFKNRYINIVAYDNSRVCLLNPAGRVKNGDYINANYVDGYQKPNAYIAAQGPLPTTFGDFWRMVWEQGSEVIVMITNLVERGKRKCDQYWPDEGEHPYGAMSVKWLKTWTTAHYTIRKFLLRNTKIKKKNLSEREILQFHFTSWPDHGVPNYHLPVLDFIYKSSAASHKMAGPPVIHCSAGVGRTGTYIVLDTMIKQLEDQKTVNVYQFLSHIRKQRNFLVQTEDQYIFIHDALKEYIATGGQTEVSQEELSKYIKHLEAGEDSDTLWPSLDKMFELCSTHKPQEFEYTAAILPCNLQKNRSKEKVPRMD